jgi:peroxiredoxin Q/BCP
MLQEGDKAPEFSAMTDSGEQVSLKDLRGKKVVLYFYPKDNTSGCTREACDFRDNLARIKRKGALVYGVSPDSEKSHQNFKTKYELTFPLIVDSDRKISEAYSTWKEKSMYGRKFFGIERATFLIDEQGKIEKIWRKVKVAGHVDDVLASL